jgi:hypothetical protein
MLAPSAPANAVPIRANDKTIPPIIIQIFCMVPPYPAV